METCPKNPNHRPRKHHRTATGESKGWRCLDCTNERYAMDEVARLKHRARVQANSLRTNLAARKARRSQMMEEIRMLKATTPCADCGGIFHPEAMDFDHLPEHEKAFEVSKHGGRKARATVLAEIAKCEIVCANCHRVRTAQRREGTAA